LVCDSDIRASHDAEKLLKNPDINKTHYRRQEFPKKLEKSGGVCQFVWGQARSYLALRDFPKSGPEREVQFVGLRFTNMRIPTGAQIKRAYLEFEICNSMAAENKGLVVRGELAANAESFTDADHNISSRRRTTASVECPELWQSTSGEVTPDLASVIQEVVDQPDWREGNALVLIISGSGKCGAKSWDDPNGRGPMLYVEH